MIARIVSSVLLFAAFSLLASSACAQEPKYKVGDRVEVDARMSSDPRNAKYVKATIVGIDDKNPADKAYLVQIDGQGTSAYRYIIRNYTKHWIRDIQGGDVTANTSTASKQSLAGPQNQLDKLRTDNSNTMLADREILDCKNLKAGPARNGQSPPTELTRNLIRCTFERPASTGQDGARTMDITGFAAAGTRRWDRREYQGMHATAATIVYIFHVKYNKKTFYRTSTEIETGGERNFACYVDGTEWYCGTAAGGVKDGEKKTIPVNR